MLNLRGVFAPVVTTFGDRNEAVDLDAYATNLRAYAAAGLSGIVVCGSTGEAALLDEEERRSLIERARQELSGDAMLIVGTGAESTRQCIQRCRVAKEHGAHAVLVVAPHYYASVMTPPGSDESRIQKSAGRDRRSAKCTAGRPGDRIHAAPPGHGNRAPPARWFRH